MTRNKKLTFKDRIVQLIIAPFCVLIDLMEQIQKQFKSCFTKEGRRLSRLDKKSRSKKYYGRSMIFTIVVYVGVFILFFVSFQMSHHTRMKVASNRVEPKIVQAVAVNQAAVQHEIHQIKARETAKRNAEVARQRHLQHLANRARKTRLQEEHHFKQLQQQQRKLALQQQKLVRQRKAQEVVAQKKLVQMRQQEQLETKRLQDLQKQQKVLASQKAAEEKSLAARKRIARAEQLLAKQISAEQTRLSAAHGREIQSEVDKYKGLILNAIGQHWIMPSNTNKKLSTVLLINLAPGGAVLNVKVLKSSGNAVLDRSVRTAILKASPLPVPKRPDLFNQFRELHLTVRPEGLL